MAIRIRLDSVPNGTKLAQDEVELIENAENAELIAPEQQDVKQAIIINSCSAVDIDNIRKVILLTRQRIIGQDYGGDEQNPLILSDQIEAAWTASQ